MFDIEITSLFTGGNPDFDSDRSRVGVNALPNEINFDMQVGIRIVPNTTNGGKFIAS